MVTNVVAFLNAACPESGKLQVHSLTEDSLVEFFASRKSLSYNTMNLCRYAVLDWCKYLTSQGLCALNIPRLNHRIKAYIPKRVIHALPKPDPSDILRLVEYAMGLASQESNNKQERLRRLRDRAFILLLVDTGIDVSAAQKLCRGDLDIIRRQIKIRTSSNRETIVSLSERVIEALRDYLDERAKSDKTTGRPSAHLPLFCGHRSNQKDQCTALTAGGVKKMISSRAAEALGTGTEGAIRPGAFRHYRIAPLFESISLLHPLVVQRCEGHFRNQNFDDAIFNAMKLVEEEVRTRVHAEPTDVGVNLITKAMKATPPERPLIVFSKVTAEQDAAHALFRGAIGSFKNPHSHRFIGVSDPFKAFECLALASLLLRMLDVAEYPA
jgi:uncharacterized protein (TIGR02391 family)